MKFSSFNWAHRGKRGWIIGPFFGRLLTITIEQRQPCLSTRHAADTCCDPEHWELKA